MGKYFGSEEELATALNRLKGEVESISGDDVTFEVTHDRPDLFSVEGIARSLKGLFRIEVGLPKLSIVNNGLSLLPRMFLIGHI